MTLAILFFFRLYFQELEIKNEDFCVFYGTGEQVSSSQLTLCTAEVVSAQLVEEGPWTCTKSVSIPEYQD